jgi:hypothetical protein
MATDASGNNGSCTFTITVNDTQSPTITCLANLTANTDANQCSAVVNYTLPTATDNCPGIGTVSCSPASGSVFSKGTTTVNCMVADGSSNTNSCAFTITVNDVQAPVINCQANISKPTDTNQCSAVVNYATPTATDNCSGVGAVTCTPASGSTFSKGVSTVSCTAVDATGNNGSCTFTVTITDTQNPTIACPANITRGTDANQCSAVVNYPLPTATDNCSNISNITCNPPSGSAFTKGTTTVNCTATDGSSNMSSCTFTVTVNDTQAPSISVPANITQTADTNQCSAIVNFTTPTATDNCPGVGSVTCTPPGGSTFVKGTTTVTCRATDAAGNNGSSTFTVTVNDTELPVISSQANITRGTDANQCSAIINFTTPAATDNCGSASVSCSPPSGSPFAKGTTTVNCTATDTSNNARSCTFTVTVNDTQNPAITCPANIIKGTDTNLCSAVVSFAPQATDNCSGAGTPVCVPPSGSVFAKGTTTVTCTVRDAANNLSAPCSFTVTVNDTQNPAIATLANISVPTATGLCAAPVSYALPGVSDNCPGVGVPVCIPPSGSSFAKGTTTVTCTVKDAVNNQASSWFTVTVTDTQSPLIVCPANITASGINPGDTTVPVSFSAPVASDNCPGVTVVCVPPSGSQFPRGATTVNCTATDAANNKTSCSFSVQVFDYVIVDDTNGKILRFNSITGDYDFFDCRKGTSMSGRGTVTITTCKTELRHTGDDPRRPDRNVYVMANPCTKSGYATITYANVTHTLNDGTLNNNISKCP